jgi:hypothetical protein
MPTVVRFASLPATVPSRIERKSDLDEFVPIALFSGIGFLASLIAVLAGVPGVWL